MMRYLTPMVLVMLLASCGSGDKDTAAIGDGATPAGETATVAAAASTDPCSLLTLAEVSEVTGDKILAANRDGAKCTFATDDDAGSASIEIDQADAKGKMEIDRSVGGTLAGIGNAVASEGGAGADLNAMVQEGGDTAKLGDEALWGPNSQLSVRKGSTYLAISPPIMHSRMSYPGNPLISTEDKRKMALALAQKALARLP